MLRHSRRKKVCPINIDTPELLHPLVGVGDGVVVFSEASRGDQAINLAVLRNDFTKSTVDRVWGGDVTVVGSDFRSAEDAFFLTHWEFGPVVLFRVGVLFLEILHQLYSLVFAFLLCIYVSELAIWLQGID